LRLSDSIAIRLPLAEFAVDRALGVFYVLYWKGGEVFLFTEQGIVLCASVLQLEACQRLIMVYPSSQIRYTGRIRMRRNPAINYNMKRKHNISEFMYGAPNQQVPKPVERSARLEHLVAIFRLPHCLPRQISPSFPKQQQMQKPT